MIQLWLFHCFTVTPLLKGVTFCDQKSFLIRRLVSLEEDNLVHVVFSSMLLKSGMLIRGVTFGWRGFIRRKLLYLMSIFIFPQVSQ